MRNAYIESFSAYALSRSIFAQKYRNVDEVTVYFWCVINKPLPSSFFNLPRQVIIELFLLHVLISTYAHSYIRMFKNLPKFLKC